MTGAVAALVAAIAAFGAGLGIAEDGRRWTARLGGFSLMAASLIALVLVFAAVA